MSEEAIEIIDESNPISEKEQIDETQDNGLQEQQVEKKIPEKFRGKSAEEIIEMYQNLEQDHSRLGNEVGKTRKLLDEVVQAELANRTAPVTIQPEEEDEPDWSYEPDKAARKLVEAEVGSVKKELDELKGKISLREFTSENKEFMEDSVTDAFKEWVSASEYRIRLYNKNASGFDPDSAQELASGWLEHKKVIDQNNTQVVEERKQKLKDASMEKGASSGGSRKKMWSRAYIRHLRLNEPSKYEANKDEIAAAYAEGRVTK